MILVYVVEMRAAPSYRLQHVVPVSEVVDLQVEPEDIRFQLKNGLAWHSWNWRCWYLQERPASSLPRGLAPSVVVT
jgi:hypothetical protein